jgi:hypothetical protein
VAGGFFVVATLADGAIMLVLDGKKADWASGKKILFKMK